MQSFQWPLLLKVHAAAGCWEQAQAVLQPTIDKAQDAVDEETEEDGSDFTGAVEAVLFELAALSLQAAWHLQHPSIAADMHSFCVHLAEATEPQEKAARVQHIVAAHLKYAAHVVNEQCSVQQLRQSWHLLQQAGGVIDTDMASEACRKEWISDAKTDV